MKKNTKTYTRNGLTVPDFPLFNDEQGLIFHVWGEGVPSKTYVYVANGQEGMATAFLNEKYGKHNMNVAASVSMMASEMAYSF